MPASDCRSARCNEHSASALSRVLWTLRAALSVLIDEKAFHRGTVPDFPRPAHRASDAVVGHEALELPADILVAPSPNDAAPHSACLCARLPRSIIRAPPSRRANCEAYRLGVSFRLLFGEWAVLSIADLVVRWAFTKRLLRAE